MKRLLLLGVAALTSLGGFKLQAAGNLTADAVRDHLKNGALLVDVRTAAEFKTGHITNAVNIPHDEVAAKIPNQVTNKSQVFLLYCRSGRRSGLAERNLRALGYTNSFNIGSFRQAETIAGGTNAR